MTKANILVVEGEAIVAVDIEMRLQDLGYCICGIATSGETAVKKAAETRPDLVLMDTNMKGHMGWVEAADRIRNHVNVPVIYLTDCADDSALRRAGITEPYGYIMKPFQERDLHTTVEIALHTQRMESKLKESERWLTSILRSLGEAVIVTNLESQVKFINPAAEALVGLTPGEALGRELAEVLTARNVRLATDVESVVTKVRQGEEAAGDGRAVLIGKDGREIPVVGTGALIRDEGGAVLGMALVFRAEQNERPAQNGLLKAQGGQTVDVLADSPRRDSHAF